MFHHHRRARVLFGLCDVIVAVLAFQISYEIRLARHWHFLFFLTAQQKALVLGVSLLCLVGLGLLLRVYESLDGRDLRQIFRDSLRQCGYSAVCVLIFQYSLRMDLSRFFLALYFSIAWLLILSCRLVAVRALPALRGDLPAVMIVGSGSRAIRLAQTITAPSTTRVRVLGFISIPGSGPAASEIVLDRRYPVYDLGELPSLLRRHALDEVLFALDDPRLGDVEEALRVCDREGVRIRMALDFLPLVNSGVSLDRLGSIPLLTFSAAPMDEVRLLVKRVIDIAVAAVALVVLSPAMVVVVLLIRLTSPGPAIFRQVRCGLNGRKFLLYKFRSMCDNAEDLKPSLLHLNTKQTAFKIPDDPRVTPLGRCLRKLSIDEWPQLWNVLRGEMSLVGPRPALPAEVDQYEPWQRRRLRMRPGLTCLWAVSGRDRLRFETWMKMDLQYIDEWSLGLDWKILLKTVPRALSGDGAH